MINPSEHRATYFIINELVLRTFCGMILLNTVIHLLLIADKNFDPDNILSFADITPLITPCKLILIVLFLFVDILIINNGNTTSFGSTTAVVWSIFWISIYTFSVIVLMGLSIKVIGMNTTIEANSLLEERSTAQFTRQGILLVIFSIISTICLSIQTFDFIIVRQIGYTLLSAMEFSFLFIFVTFARYIKEKRKKKDNNKIEKKKENDVLDEFRTNNSVRGFFVFICCLNVYQLLYSFVFNIQNYMNLIAEDDDDENSKKHTFFFISYGLSFASTELSLWALFQFLDVIFSVLLTEEEIKKNECRISAYEPLRLLFEESTATVVSSTVKNKGNLKHRKKSKLSQEQYNQAIYTGMVEQEALKRKLSFGPKQSEVERLRKISLSSQTNPR